METLAWLFSIDTIVAVVFDYPLSLGELLGTTFGMWSVLLATCTGMELSYWYAQ